MSFNEEYTCPRCGFIFKIELKNSESNCIVNCNKCEKTMNIRNIRNILQLNITQQANKKVHYLHKSLLN